MDERSINPEPQTDLAACRLVLASCSPRRKELLALAGLDFDIVPVDLAEQVINGETPEQAAVRLACAKAEAAGDRFPECVVLGADTVVAMREGPGYVILGKPADADDAERMLLRLQGREHVVATAFALRCVRSGFSLSRCSQALVVFRDLSLAEIKAYVASGEPMDKAGAYAVQGWGRMFISSINGSYTSIVGLPLSEVLLELQRIGVWSPSLLTGVNRPQSRVCR